MKELLATISALAILDLINYFLLDQIKWKAEYEQGNKEAGST
jgi:hypothetical protein